MGKGLSAKRFAQALFSLGRDQGASEAWLGQLRDAELALADKGITEFLRSPRVRLEEKTGMIRGAFTDCDKIILNTICLLISRQSLSILPEVVKEYSSILDLEAGRLQATVTSAVALGSAQSERLGVMLKQVFDAEVVLDVQEDPELIGGMVIKVGDQVIDGSVKTRLRQLRLQLLERTVE